MAIERITNKVEGREQRKTRIRRKIFGTAERPRLSVYRSLGHLYAQVVDDTAGRTLASASTMSPQIRDGLKGLKKAEQARKVGEYLARVCAERHVTRVVFDRNGFLYHGRVAALAEGAREGGLAF